MFLIKLFKVIRTIILMPEKDYLSEDTMLPEGQTFVCISFLSDPDNKLTLKGVKVRGVFSDLEKASEHAKKLQAADTAHNVFVGEMGKWLAFEPDVNSEAAGNPEYANEQLNSIMKSYQENQDKAKLFHEQRKYQSIQKSLEETLKTSNDTAKDLREQIDAENDEEKQKTLQKQLEVINDKIKEIEDKKKDYQKKEKKVSEEINV